MRSMKTLTLRVAVVVPQAYIMRPTKKVFFLPKTSCNLLPVSMREAIVNAYIAIKAWIVLKSVFKSTTTADMATFMAELSRTMMKMAMHATTTTPHLNCGFSSIETPWTIIYRLN